MKYNYKIKKGAPLNSYLFGVLLLIIGILFPTLCQNAFAACESPLKLEGTIAIDSCAPDDKGCISASKAIFDYSMSAKIEKGVYGAFMDASPWHFYDGNMRILAVDEVADMIKKQIGDHDKGIELIASWSGVAPDPTVKSLADKISDELGGFPVKGMDGFVWLSKDGVSRTTQQAFTLRRLYYPYKVRPGAEVMVSARAGWAIEYEEDFVKKGDAEGIMRAGAGWDIFMLCPDKALRAFEAAAKLSNSIAAYNAALIYLERGKEGDLKAATALLTQAAEKGDKPAQVRLQKLKSKTNENRTQQNAQPDSR